MERAVSILGEVEVCTESYTDNRTSSVKHDTCAHTWKKKRKKVAAIVVEYTDI